MTPTYKIGSEIIARHEDALIQELPELYSDEGEREIVEQILIPQFRILIRQALEEFADERKDSDVVLPTELPVLCGKVEDIITINQILLDLDGLFKPLLKRIQEVRIEIAKELEEEFLQKCREVLNKNGVDNRFSLLGKDLIWFRTQIFDHFGKGHAFASKILGRAVGQIDLFTLEEIADKIFSEVSKHDVLDKYRQVLQEKGVHDRFSLLKRGPSWYRKQTFTPFGKGYTFASKILGRPVGKIISVPILEEIADILFPRISDDVKLDKYRRVLAKKGVTDRLSLIKRGSLWYKKQTFAPFGKGFAFAIEILGRPIRYISLSILEEIADKLFPEVSESDLLDKYRQVLREKGIDDPLILLARGPIAFMKESYTPFGKGFAFAQEILGRSIKVVTISELKEIVNILFPDFNLLESCRKILRDKGVTDRFTLLEKGPNWFTNESFEPFGKGKVFAKWILERSTGTYMSQSNLEEIADKLDFPSSSEEDTLDKCRLILRKKGITDRLSLLEKGPNWFTNESFEPFGKGKFFVKVILGRSVRYINFSVLEEVADKFFSEISEIDLLDKYRLVLSEKGISDRISLLSKSANWFGYESFHPFGKGVAFANRILGQPQRRITISIIKEIADKLFPED